MCKDTTLKFNVQKRLNILPKEEYDAIIKNLPLALGITRQTLHKIRTCGLNSRYEPNSHVMISLASFFDVEPRDLYTNPPVKLAMDDVKIIDRKKTVNDLNLIAL